MQFQRNAARLQPVASVHQSDAPAFPRRNSDAGSVLLNRALHSNIQRLQDFLPPDVPKIH